jgi:uncharacterized protein YutE (UPF0331/DUF86 family)
MSPEVIARKLALMSRYVQDSIPYKDVSFEDFMSDHYKIERLLELLVMTAADIAFHLLTMKGEPPATTYRAAFLRLGEIGVVSTAQRNKVPTNLPKPVRQSGSL